MQHIEPEPFIDNKLDRKHRQLSLQQVNDYRRSSLEHSAPMIIQTNVSLRTSWQLPAHHSKNFRQAKLWVTLKFILPALACSSPNADQTKSESWSPVWGGPITAMCPNGDQTKSESNNTVWCGPTTAGSQTIPETVVSWSAAKTVTSKRSNHKFKTNSSFQKTETSRQDGIPNCSRPALKAWTIYLWRKD